MYIGGKKVDAMSIIIQLLQAVLDTIDKILFYIENNQTYERKNEFKTKRMF